jgi:CheY-like chemotaxis protein
MPELKQILIVDDEFAMRHILKSILAQLGDFNILEAKNGLEAINIMVKYRPDLVFLDVYMPVLSGIETLRRKEGIAELKHIPVIMCTAEANPKTVQSVIFAGAKDYVVKPFTMEVIHKKTKKWLNME